jgi:hypothetical protein
MGLKVLNQDQALSTGCDLWVLPSTAFSEWTKKLDWPLNLQISKASHHSTRKPAPELASILQQNDLKFDVLEPEKTNLIIASKGLIPAKSVVIVPGDTWEAWSKAAVKVWQNLEEPSARFFLPAFAKWHKVKNSWPSSANLESVEIVEAEG